MTRLAAAMFARGERRLRDRRQSVPPDAMTELVNRITADRDRLRDENRKLRAAVAKAARIIELGMRQERAS